MNATQPNYQVMDMTHAGPKYEPELVIVVGLKAFREKFTDLRGLVEFAEKDNENGQPRFVKVYFTADDPIDEIPDFSLVKSHQVILPDYINIHLSDDEIKSFLDDVRGNWKKSLEHHERVFTLRPRRMTL